MQGKHHTAHSGKRTLLTTTPAWAGFVVLMLVAIGIFTPRNVAALQLARVDNLEVARAHIYAVHPLACVSHNVSKERTNKVIAFTPSRTVSRTHVASRLFGKELKVEGRPETLILHKNPHEGGTKVEMHRRIKRSDQRVGTFDYVPPHDKDAGKITITFLSHIDPETREALIVRLLHSITPLMPPRSRWNITTNAWTVSSWNSAARLDDAGFERQSSQNEGAIGVTYEVVYRPRSSWLHRLWRAILNITAMRSD